MVNLLRYNFAKFMGKMAAIGASYGSGMGKSFPGWLFFKFGTYESLNDLANELAIGSILITGTNGKTTTTVLTTKLLSNDIDIDYSFESNTINAIATGLLKGSADLGVFEYGIRDLTHGIPDTVQRLVNPVGVVYTTISREHTQIKGIKNPFNDYYKAKSLLSENMNKGVIITNADDPRTAYIGIKKQKDVHINYYAMEADLLDPFPGNVVYCPSCNRELEYSKRFMNHRGIYKCECGFKRPEPNVKMTEIEITPSNFNITLEANDVYNYTNNKHIDFKVKTKLPPFGPHNLYNALCAATTYASFTPKIENIENNINEVFKEINMSILPPGRFEILKLNGDKLVGIGQGDNGDAVKSNAHFMSYYIEGPLEFIYTTPDIGEEEIFQDHLEVIRLLNPEHLIVVPGRQSVEVAEKYYNDLKEEFSTDFYPLSYEKISERIEKLANLAYESRYKYIIITGCGEEQVMWDAIKQKLTD